MERWLIFLHVLSAFGFLIAHGASANVAFRLRQERNLDRIRALLDLSTGTYNLMYASLLTLLITGIIAGFVRDAWGRGWIWTSLVLFIVIAVIMFVRGSLYYSQIRRAVGMQWFDGRRAHDPESPQSEQEVSKLLNSRKPEETAMIGGVGLALILWLMMFRPF